MHNVDPYITDIHRRSVCSIAVQHGMKNVRRSSVEVLADLLHGFLMSFSQEIQRTTTHSRRPEANLHDALFALIKRTYVPDHSDHCTDVLNFGRAPGVEAAAKLMSKSCIPSLPVPWRPPDDALWRLVSGGSFGAGDEPFPKGFPTFLAAYPPRFTYQRTPIKRLTQTTAKDMQEKKMKESRQIETARGNLIQETGPDDDEDNSEPPNKKLKTDQNSSSSPKPDDTTASPAKPEPQQTPHVTATIEPTSSTSSSSSSDGGGAGTSNNFPPSAVVKPEAGGGELFGGAIGVGGSGNPFLAEDKMKTAQGFKKPTAIDEDLDSDDEYLDEKSAKATARDVFPEATHRRHGKVSKETRLEEQARKRNVASVTLKTDVDRDIAQRRTVEQIINAAFAT
eukprot:TRINITY_DN10396_c0_g1_i1.p1 TRINITY_DN10396_c0_g1~~TRINITY_DN10396_c0_g1_i1.p1  ORF type:complete len:394 (-),score=39.06 TRINITY_DN10396_c0_g1_i1:522-1703(-)